MAEIKLTRCPYCGSGVLEEEDGYRCRLCKSFFPYNEEQNEKVTQQAAPAKQPAQEVDLERFSMIRPHAPQTEKEKEFQRIRFRAELIGMATAFVSAVFMALCKLLSIPLLMIPGFLFWAFSAGFTGYNVYKALKAGHRMLYIRVFLFLALAIVILFLMQPKK